MNVKQTKELLNIINKNQLIAIGANFGPDFFTDEDRELLDAYRVPWRRLYKMSEDSIQMSFAFGMLAEALKDQVKNISYENFKTYIESGGYIPMSDLDKAIVNNVKLTAFSSAKTLQGKIFSDVNGVVNNKSKQAEWLQAEARRGLKDKKTVAEIAREIAEKTGDWSRNFERMIAYAAHTALENGKAAMMMKDWGPDVLVYKQPMKGACKHCVRLYLTNGEGSAPRVFKLSDLIANGSNIGRKTADWKATLDSLHPYCRCPLKRMPSNRKWSNRTKKFEASKDKKQEAPTRKRAPIRVVIGGKEYQV